MTITIELTETEIAAIQKAITNRALLIIGRSGDEWETEIDALDNVLEKLRTDDDLAACEWTAPWGTPRNCQNLADPNDQNGPGDDILCIEHQTEAWREHEGERQGEQMREDA